VEKGSHRAEDSTDFSPTSSLGGKLIHCGEVVLLQIRVLVENLCFGHASTQPAEDVPYGYAQTSNARFAPTLARLNRNPLGSYRHHYKYDTQVDLGFVVYPGQIRRAAAVIDAAGAPILRRFGGKVFTRPCFRRQPESIENTVKIREACPLTKLQFSEQAKIKKSVTI